MLSLAERSRAEERGGERMRKGEEREREKE